MTATPHVPRSNRERAVPCIGESRKHRAGLADNAIHLDYLRHVAGVDDNIGRLLAALDELGLGEVPT